MKFIKLFAIILVAGFGLNLKSEGYTWCHWKGPNGCVDQNMPAPCDGASWFPGYCRDHQ